jgi:3-hydroxyacyl-CoA dehydrogenase
VLELLDFIGLDTLYYIARSMVEERRQPRFAPSLLACMVQVGLLARKNGCRFYEY